MRPDPPHSTRARRSATGPARARDDRRGPRGDRPAHARARAAAPRRSRSVADVDRRQRPRAALLAIASHAGGATRLAPIVLALGLLGLLLVALRAPDRRRGAWASGLGLAGAGILVAAVAARPEHRTPLSWSRIHAPVRGVALLVSGAIVLADRDLAFDLATAAVAGVLLYRGARHLLAGRARVALAAGAILVLAVGVAVVG